MGEHTPDLVEDAAREAPVEDLRREAAKLERKIATTKQTLARLTADHKELTRQIQAATAEAAQERVAAVARELYGQGMSIPQIAEATGIAPAHVRKMVGMTRSRGNSDEQLLDALRTAAAELGHTPTQSEYAEIAARLGVSGPQGVRIRFGSWTEACRLAGLTPDSTTGSGPRRDRKWTPDRCWTVARALGRELGYWPTLAEYRELAPTRDDLPSESLLRSRIGSWAHIRAEVEATLAEDAA